MQTSSLAEILESTKKFVAAKNAELKDKSAKGLDTTGAKDDAPIQHKDTLTASEPAKEVPEKKDSISGDANAKPPSNESGTGSNKAEGKNEGNQTDRVGSGVYEADQAVMSPTKKDLISGDANAKQAATVNLANEIVGDIRKYQEASKAAAQKPAVVPVKDEKKAEGKEEKAEAKMPPALKAKIEKSESPAKEKAEDAAEAKSAQGPNMELTTDVLAKIAASILSQEEGALFVEQMLAKQAGAEAAQEVMNFLAAQSEAAEKQAAYAAGQADADALVKAAIYAQGQKDAQAQAKNANFNKLGQEVADASMADLTAAQGAGMGGGAPMDPGMAGGADEEISMEDLAAALEALVQEGTLQPEEAQQIVEGIVAQQGGGGEGAAPGAAPEAAPAAAPAEAPAEGGAEKEEEKESAAKKPATPETKVAALLETINKLRAAKK